MNGMLSGCKKLKEIKGLNKFFTEKVTNMNSKFQECFELEYIDLFYFNILNVIDIVYLYKK